MKWPSATDDDRPERNKDMTRYKLLENAKVWEILENKVRAWFNDESIIKIFDDERYALAEGDYNSKEIARYDDYDVYEYFLETKDDPDYRGAKIVEKLEIVLK